MPVNKFYTLGSVGLPGGRECVGGSVGKRGFCKRSGMPAKRQMTDGMDLKINTFKFNFVAI